jgi:hypothetical protein
LLTVNIEGHAVMQRHIQKSQHSRKDFMKTFNNSTTYSNSDLKQQMYWMQVDSARLSADKGKHIKDIIQAVFGAIDAYAGEIAVIEADPDLSLSGKRSRTDAAGKRVAGIVSELSKPALAELNADILRLTHALSRAAAGEADDASRTLLKIEARQLAAQIDPLLLQTQYMALCESGDDNLTCEAIEQAPVIGRMLSAETLAAGRVIRAAKLHPDQAEALRQAQEARAILASAVEQVKAMLGQGHHSAAMIAALVDEADADGLAA